MSDILGFCIRATKESDLSKTGVAPDLAPPFFHSSIIYTEHLVIGTVVSNVICVVKRIDENLTFDEQILGAAKSVTNAVQTLVRAAGSAQRELVAQGRFAELLQQLTLFFKGYMI